jgi:hypothetical protein
MDTQRKEASLMIAEDPFSPLMASSVESFEQSPALDTANENIKLLQDTINEMKNQMATL